MRYLITYTENGLQKAFYTNWFDPENNFNADLNMIVFNLSANKFTTDGYLWLKIDEDHL